MINVQHRNTGNGPGGEGIYILGSSTEHIPMVESGLPSIELSPSRVRPSVVTNFCKCTSALIADPSTKGPRVILLLDPTRVSSKSSTLSVRDTSTFNTILHSLTVATREPLTMPVLGLSSHVSMIHVGVMMSISASMIYAGGWTVVSRPTAGPTTTGKQ